jgi:peptidoglycan/LPS O-acetylase OafA/YrhL
MIDHLLARLSRVTTSGRYIPEIDGLRFVAILLVFMIHINYLLFIKSHISFIEKPSLTGLDPNPLLQVAKNGYYGVHLFFVISGFILGLPFAAHYLGLGPRVPLGKYFLRRVTRLEPPYLLSMAGLFVFYLLISLVKYRVLTVHGLGLRDLLIRFVSSCLYLHGIIFAEKSPINFVAWSLEIEVQFYLLAPLLACVFTIRHKLVRRGVIAAVILLLVASEKALGINDDPWLSLTILSYGQYFLAGFLLADVYVVDWDQSPVHDPRWDLVSLIGWPALFVVIEWEAGRDAILPFLFVLLYVAVFRGVWLRCILTNRWITTIGGMCYSIYLLHIAIITAFGALTLNLMVTRHYWINFLVQALLLALPVLCVSGIFFALVERPCMRRDWPQSLWRWLKLRWLQVEGASA